MSAAVVSVDQVESFQSARSRLFAVAYGVLGDAAEADDVVQDAWTRWQRTNRDVVRDATAFLATTTKRLAFNVADSARARRETYVGPWLSERVDSGPDPARAAEQGDELEAALLVLMERLAPTERAAYVLREAFDYPYREIARVLALSEENARQVVTRARVRIEGPRRRSVDPDERRRFAETFAVASETGDLAALEEFFVAA